MLKIGLLVLVTQVLTGCGGGYWHRQLREFDLGADCRRCGMVAGTIESEEYAGPIEPKLYTLTAAVIRLSSGNRVKADSVRFNGATGAFVTPQLRGYLLSDEAVIALPAGEPIQIYASQSRGVRGGMLYRDTHLARGNTAIRAPRLRSFNVKQGQGEPW